MNRLRRHGFGWVTLTLFLSSLAAHFALSLATGNSLAEWARDVAENIQSEMAQLLLQVVGLSFLLQVGSPASKEAAERLEAKVDILLSAVGADGAIEDLDRRHQRR